MAGEIIQATTTEEAEMQIMSIYKKKSYHLHMITREEYEKIDKSEREDSDNHLNLQRLGKDTKVVDLAYYKFLPKGESAFRIDLVDHNQKLKKQLFFITKLMPDQ